MSTETTDKINKLALLLVLLFAVSISVTLITKVTEIIYPDFNLLGQLTIQTKMFHIIFWLFQMVVFIGSAIWLYLQAKQENNNPWVWAFLGLFTGIFGVILWFLNQILKTLKNKTA